MEKLIINCETGEVQPINMTQEEIQALQPTLEQVKQSKLNELYNVYQQEKNNKVISSLIGSDGFKIVFEYGESNQTDYQKIAGKFGLISTLTESIIGSKSHGKFYISRGDFEKLVQDFDNHEVSLYIKFSEKKTLIEAATTIEKVEVIVW